MNYFKRLAFGIVIASCSFFSADRVSAQTLSWRNGVKYDNGVKTSVALNSSGFVVEMHQAEELNGPYWYHVGRLSDEGMQWGKSQLMKGVNKDWLSGKWNSVALTKDNYVIFAYSTKFYKSSSQLSYWIGRLQPDGGVNQSIEWLVKDQIFDSGFHPSVAVNDSGVIVEAHESGSGGKGIYYRLGHMKNPNAGEYQIVWDSGDLGIKYDDGVNPHIAIDSQGNVVELHQVNGERLLHYRRGTINAEQTRINFGDAPRYDSKGASPAIALTDFGLALEIHNTGGAPYSATGYLSLVDPYRIDWQPAKNIYYAGFDAAVATNGVYAVATWNDQSDNLIYSYAGIP